MDVAGRCLHALGPIERHLIHARGPATQDIITLVRPALRGRLRAAMELMRGKGDGLTRDATAAPVIEVRAVTDEGEAMLLVSFLDATEVAPVPKGRPAHPESQIAALERELEVTRAELRGAIQELEAAGEEQRTARDEALSVSEEYQSTNEELLTSKEELQSLNEELTVLNGQLQETLEASRTTSDDLQNVLYSTDVATLFLDRQLRIRFFTPATRAVFGVLPGDVGRPLADLRPLASDPALLEDAAAVLRGDAPPPQEVEAPGNVWFSRRALPYRGRADGVDGVVITYSDITARRAALEALAAATRRAEEANAAKSRFLSAASHDLRQPLQTLTLLQALQARMVQGEEQRRLVVLMGSTVSAMAGMLDGLLDLNQIEAGALIPQPAEFEVGPLLEGLVAEFGYLAAGRDLMLRSVPCSRFVRSDPRLLGQILRNLLSNALKYTRAGRVLVGCRRRGDALAIEVWDTGIGIPAEDLPAVFEEYRQLDNAARERAKGLGLGLAIVRRLADLLGHRLRVRSEPGRGSVFSIEVPMVAGSDGADVTTAPERPGPRAAILVVEDDPDLRDLLVSLLRAEGHQVLSVATGPEALSLVSRGAIRPDLLLTDHALPGGLDGPALALRLRTQLGGALPVLLLTAVEGEPDAGTAPWTRLRKPILPTELIGAVRTLLEQEPAPDLPAGPVVAGGLHVVDDDGQIRVALRRILEGPGRPVADHASAEAFLAAYRPAPGGCIVLDAQLPGMSGFDLLRRLRLAGDATPAIVITGFGDVGAAVEAMRAGASDFLEKPVQAAALLECVERAIERSRDAVELTEWQRAAAERIAALTPRQREIMDRILAGQANKNIAAHLGISQRTVETHRATIMRRAGVRSLPELARLALAAAAPPTVPGGEG